MGIDPEFDLIHDRVGISDLAWPDLMLFIAV